MKKNLPIYLSLLLLLTCAKEDSQDPGTTPSNITPKYTLTATAGEGGSVAPSSGSFNAGTQVSITATPSSGYQFINWSNDSTVNPLTIILNSDFSITANFEVIINSYTLTVTSGEGGSISNEGGEYNEGTEVTLTATPEEGYRFIGWSDDSTEESITITLSEDTTLEALFELIPIYTVTVTSQEGGSVSTEGGEYEEGAEVTITATPEEGYEFIEWSDGEASAERIITISENQTLIAEFEKKIVYFQSLSPVFDNINQSTTFYKENYYSPNVHITPWKKKNDIIFSEGCDEFGGGCALRYSMWGSYNSIFLDFNNDQKLDYFAWTYPVIYENGLYKGDPGMYVIIEDYFNEFNIRHEITDDVRFDGRPEIGDFNGDGRDDILVYNQNHHAKWGNLPGSDDPVYERRNIKILYFNDDGSFYEFDTGIEGGSHAMSTMDIDNDGDTDIVFGHMGGKRIPGDITDRISIYINDGSGNFEQKNELFKYPDEFYDYEESNPDMFSNPRPHHNHNVAGMDAFDIDGDGFLDLITGNGPTCGDDQPNYFWEADIRIYWGDNSYAYDYDRSLKIDADCNLNDTYNFSFIDYNLDGKMDILYSGPGRQGDIMIGLLKNNGNKDFSDVTSQQIDRHSVKRDGSPIAFNNDSDLPGGVRFSIIDVDGDGDFDIFPYDIHLPGNWLWKESPAGGNNNNENKFNLPDNSIFAYWENNGGYFTFKSNFKD